MMLRVRLADVFARLRAEGLAPAGAESAVRAALDREDDVPWFVRLAVGIGAWAATGFLIAFLAALDLLEDDVVRTLFGGLMLAMAVVVRRAARAEFLRQASVALALAGSVMVVTGIGEFLQDVTIAGVATAILSVVLVRLMPDAVFRFLATIAGAAGAAIAAVDANARVLFELTAVALVAFTAYVWRGDVSGRGEGEAEMLGPVGYGLVVALFGMLIFGPTVADGSLGLEIGRRRNPMVLGPITTIGITAALLALEWKVIEEHGASLSSPASFAALLGAAALGAGALWSPGIVAEVAVLMLAFDRRNPVLLGLGVLFVIFFLSRYYYSLQLTLLEKSGVLAGSGLLLLAVRSRIVPRARGEAAP